MYFKSRTFRDAPPDIFKDYVPGRLVLDSESAGWESMPVFSFEFAQFHTEGMTPPVDAYTFGLVISGNLKAESSINRGAWIPRVVVPGHITLVPAGHTSNARWVPREDNPPPVHMTMLQLPCSVVNKVASEAMDIDPGKIEVAVMLHSGDLLVEQMIISAQDELLRGNPCGPLYAETAVQLMVMHMLGKYCTFAKKIPADTHGLTKSQLKKVLEYIHASYNGEISLKILASLVGMSEYHFLRLFKKSVKQSPLQYIINLRMRAAKDFLSKTNLPVSQIAASVGYDSVSHFVSIFKRYYGVTPAVYRKRI